MNSRKGFTLIEMVIVLAIIGVLAATAYPRMTGYMETRREQYRQNQEYIVNKTLMQYYALTGSYIKADCGSGNITDVNSLFNELRNKTGATITNTGEYEYATGVSGFDVDIKKITVELLP